MKKIKNLLLIFVLSVSFFSYSFAVNSWTWITNTWTTNSEENTIPEEISDYSYTYYYGQGCAYCANVDRYMNSVDWFERVDIQKIEVYGSDENRQAMLADWERLWLPVNQIGVPFLIVDDGETETPIIWDQPFIDYFKPFLWEAPENENLWIILAILWVLAILLPVFLIKLSSKN